MMAKALDEVAGSVSLSRASAIGLIAQDKAGKFKLTN